MYIYTIVMDSEAQHGKDVNSPQTLYTDLMQFLSKYQ